MATRRDFELLAQALKWSKPPTTATNYQDRLYAWSQAVTGIANACHEINPRFDFNKFFTACSLQATA